MNNYEILGLSKGASISEVKSKFRQLSKKYHPDMPTGDAAKFISIRKAYEALLKGDSGEQPQSGGFGSGYARDSRSQQPGYDQHDQRFWGEFNRQQQRSAKSQWEQQQSWQQQRAQQQRRSPAQYRFISIAKDSNGYVIKLFVDRVDRVEVYGKKGYLIGIYPVRSRYGEVRLGINWKDADLADYQFRIVLEDADGYSATMTYKVKPPFVPNWYQKILIKLKIKKYE